MTLAYRFATIFFFLLFKIFFRFKIDGIEKVPEKGGVIVVSNHSSHLDPLVIGAAIRKRQSTFMAKRGLFKIPLVGAFVKTFSFPVDRDTPQPSTIKEAVRRLKNGELIVMFPEGGRSRDGSLLDAKRGTGLIAALSGAKVVPAYIDGTDTALPAGAKLIRRSSIRIIFGNPIETSPYGGGRESGRDFQERIGNDIMEAIRSLKNKMSLRGSHND
ncbi:MAG: lysophospholipid acyltransferase family protein [Thermodesulfovibrionales bacterium]|nr:lysophospholipid acyltransferase family protein [Thermodesulfovibrionales bacterium]